jgi:plastocyanin
MRLIDLLAAASIVAAATPAAADPDPGGTGTITGAVIFEGDPPARDPVVRKGDKFCAKTGEHLSDDVIVVNHKVRDVLVRIQNGTTGDHTAPTTPVVIDQRDCNYAPRVVGAMPGQQIQVRNSDNTFHNVHGTVDGKLVFNKPHEAKSADLALDTYARAGDVLELSCDVHDWMHAWVVVSDSPYFAVTGDDGAFTISGLAPGTYTLEAWHPKLGTKTLTVKIGVGGKANVRATLSYKP